MGTAADVVTSAEVFQVEAPIANPAGPAGATYASRGSVFVRIEDGEGRVGWGETYPRAGTVAVVTELLELVLDRRPRDRLALLDALSGLTHDRFAVSAVAIALDDLWARQLEVPVYDLYGGRRRDRVPSYASSGGYVDGVPLEESWLSELDAAREAGFGAAKFRIGRFPVAREVAALRQLRSVAGPEIDLMVDGNGAYAVPAALRVGRVLDELDVRWFEEPLTRFQHGLAYPGYELLSGLEVAVAAGEGLSSRSAFDDFLARGAAQIVQPDVGICGGIAEALFVAELAALRGRQCVPHAWGGGILLAATLHLLAALRDPSEVVGADAPLLEVDRLENPFRTELWGGEVRPVEGFVEVPAGPGLGIEFDEKFIRNNARVSRRAVKQ